MLRATETPLEDIWIVSLFERAAKTPISAGIILTVSTTLFGLMLSLMPWPHSAPLSDEIPSLNNDLVLPAFPIEFLLMGLILSLSYFFASRGVADVALLEEMVPSSPTSAVTKKRMRSMQIALTLLFFLLMKLSDIWLYYSTYQNYGLTHFGLLDAVIAPFSRGLESSIHALFSHGLLAMCWAILVTVIWHHSQRLNTFAKRVDVNLLDFSDYATVSNALVRLVITVGFLLSFFPIASLIIYHAIQDIVYVHISLVSIGSMPLLLMLSWSVRTLQGRVRKIKQDELEKVRSLMFEEGTSLENGGERNVKLLGGAIKTANKTDLLTYQMFLETRWEWPIAPHVQKLLLFGLLPPVTWVLAAIVENIMY